MSNACSPLCRFLSAVFLTITICAGVIPAEAQSTMPFIDDFEEQADGAVVDWDGWEQGGSEIKLQQAVTYTMTNAVHIPEGEALTNNFGGGSVARVWTEMYVQPTLESSSATSSPAVPPYATAFFYFNSNGYAKVWDGDHWDVLTTTAAGSSATPYTPGTWMRLTVYKNYNTDTWAIFTNTVLLAENLDFNAPESGLHHFSVGGGAYLDNVHVNTYFPSNAAGPHASFDVDTDGDGSGDIWELHYFTSASTYGAGEDVDGDGLRNEEEWQVSGGPGDPTSAGSAIWTVPYYQTLETGSHGVSLAGTWKGLSLTGTCAIRTNEFIQGEKALQVSTGAVTYEVTSPNPDDTNIWVQAYLKGSTYDDSVSPPTVDDETPAAFYVQQGTGRIRMYSGNGWVYSDHVYSVPTNEWLGFALHLDYVTEKWTLHVATNVLSYGNPMVCATTNILDLNINHTNGSFTGIGFETEGVTYFDAIAVSPGFDPVSSLYTNLVTQERIANESVLTALPPYEYTGEDRELDSGLLGDHLARGLKPGPSESQADRAKILVDLPRTFWLSESSGNWQGAGIDTYRATNSITIDREPGTDFLVFYPYASKVAESYYDTTLYGTDHASAGWNVVAWPADYPARALNGVTPDTGLPTSNYPEVWLYRDYHYIRLYYRPGVGWMDSSQRPPVEGTLQLMPGEVFFYRRRVTGEILWAPVRD